MQQISNAMLGVQPGVRGMVLPGGSGYDERGNMLGQTQPRGLTDILRRGLMMPSQPVASQPKGLGGMLGATRMTPPDMPQRVGAPMPYNPINTTRLEDLRPRGCAGMSMGSILQGLRNMQQQPRSGFVDTMPKMNMPAPTGPQVMAPNAQGMAMGGLMAKYYGGAC
ncbi:MAG: hypothetical protein ACK47H_04830 [Akkermansiaceae bacterium]